MKKKVILLDLILMLLAVFFPFSVAAESGDIDFSVSIADYLNIELSSASVHLVIRPSSVGSVGTGYMDSIVSTNNSTGYSLNFTITDLSGQPTTDLTSDKIDTATGQHPVIPTISSANKYTLAQLQSATSADVLNHWGMSIDSTSEFGAAEPYGTIAYSDSAIADDTTRVNFAAKLDLETTPGIYSAVFNFEVVANPASSPVGP